MASPFDEDLAVVGIAERFGMTVERRPGLEITDVKALDAAGLTKKAPDYGKIRRLLDEGHEVAGAHLGEMEYVFRRAKRGT
jgi:hypothetical protein